MKALVIVDESTGDARRVTHGMDLALELARAEDLSVRVFLLGATVDLARADGPGRAPAQGAAIARLVSGGVELAVSEAEMATRGLRLRGPHPGSPARFGLDPRGVDPRSGSSAGVLTNDAVSRLTTPPGACLAVPGRAASAPVASAASIGQTARPIRSEGGRSRTPGVVARDTTEAHPHRRSIT